MPKLERREGKGI
uniref:Uncharacterized protein n=1 Tax=Anguilla anguilla TaxID=7936 RepID=A0A0E9VK73_ANGAN